MEVDKEICFLQEENSKLKSRIEGLEFAFQQLQTYSVEQNKVLSLMLKKMETNIEQYDILSRHCNSLWAIVNNFKYELKDPDGYKADFFYPQFRSNEETLRLIIENRKSLARFGDGEFSIAFNIARQKFQRLDTRLAKRIWQVMKAGHLDLLIGIARNYGDLTIYNKKAANRIRFYMTEEVRKKHQQILQTDTVYSDAYITRPYVLYRDMFTEEPKKRFDALKKIWTNKKIMIVEGALTRLGVGNDLFKDASGIKRILAPATSSFDRYDDILRECLMHADEVDLFILAIGPASGVLAYDLTVEGYQAVDVGHIDLEYEWFLAGKGIRVSVPHKYNNEVENGDQVETVDDPLYEKTIIASFE